MESSLAGEVGGGGAMKLEEIIGGTSPFAESLGIRVARFGEGAGQCFLDIEPYMRNRHRSVHGGVIYSLADIGMGVALYSLLKKGQQCATIELQMNYLEPARGDRLVCNGLVLRKGGSLAFLEAEIFDQQVLVAKGTGTFTISGRRGGADKGLAATGKSDVK